MPYLHDPVNRPSHYTQGSIECIDAMLELFGIEKVKVFCQLNAFKYLWRTDAKNGVEDLKKSNWYLKKYLELNEEPTHEHLEKDEGR